MTPLWALTRRLATRLTVLSVPFALAAGAAAQQKQPSIEELLKRLLREQQDQQTVAGGGTIKVVRIRGGTGANVELEVQLTGVTQPARAKLEVTLYNLRLQTLEGVSVTHDPVPAGDSTVGVQVTYTGSGSVATSAARVALIDSSSGKAWSRFRMALTRQLSGTGAETGAAPGQTGERAAQIFDLTPEPVGDTAGAGAAIRPGLVRAPVAPVAAGAARVHPTVAATPVTGGAERLHPVVAAIPIVDLYGLASQASWSSTAGALPFNAPDNDVRGFVRPLGRATLIDGATYESVLETHPSWIAYGSIQGSYQLTIPASATRFVSKVGLLAGASSSDGVVVKVVLRGAGAIHMVATRQIRPSDGVVELSGNIPESWRGRPVTLELRVGAGVSARQDWLTWVAPAIR
ncbi:MAG: hypothetical protein A2Y78_04980 [Acidobacteria bacterium RBG_13_68_16]|jgi:hypothetical protein|nr:MAG: hypothetical protein A2Y78_04980 [Acidobacteria bacterium RBG_13_68_16]